jgi:hypothetical protein
MVEYIHRTAPSIAGKCRLWCYNDGDGLNAEHSADLAERLDYEIASGRTGEYVRAHADKLALEPDTECFLCKASGTFKGVRCILCQGAGTWPATAVDGFIVADLREFVTFLRGCGGFEIW